ncbi:MAG: peroxiredoxin [Candidatus Gracilibacteria bacterium]|nr:peroxiredoxin [Candidatus Gracilibacteria bacterium]
MNLEQKYDAITAGLETATLDMKTLLSFSDRTLLYFYPKDNTPGCTVENKDFSALKKEFSGLGITIIGVSKDSISSHEKFITSQELQIDLISDPELILHKELGAYGEKNNYGKIVQGVIRSTFLFNQKGDILKEWKNIRAKGHAERVLKELS